MKRNPNRQLFEAFEANARCRNIRRAFAAAAALLSCVPSGAMAGADDPRVPPGRDPGGIPVAVVGAGIDYIKSNVAPKLARDGEGEIIGYDFIDDDRRPYDLGPGTAIAEMVTAEGQAATLIVVRANMSDSANAGRAIRYTSATPAKICLLMEPVTGKEHAALVSAAAAAFKGLLFIVPVTDPDSASRVIKPPNLVMVAAKTENHGAGSPAAADLIAPTASDAAPTSAPAASPAASLAAARIAALAARLQSVEPSLAPNAIKERILALAEPAIDAAATAPGPRILVEPRRHFWLD